MYNNFMEKVILEGNISVKAALFSKWRTIEKIYVDQKKHDKDTNYILANAYQANIEVVKVERSVIDEMASGKTHGGLIAIASCRTYQTLDDLANDDFISIVEGVEDPFNLGHVIRSLYACGCKALLLNKRNLSHVESVICKASAGASEKMAIVMIDDFKKVMPTLKKNYQIICANRTSTSQIMYDVDYSKPTCIAIGGEKRGLNRAILDAADIDVYIPYLESFKNALSAVSATTILAAEVMRQRLKKGI